MAQIGPKIKNAQNLLKLGTFDISNMQVSILISKIILMKYLPHVRPKLAHEFLAWINKVNRHKKEFNGKIHKTTA